MGVELQLQPEPGFNHLRTPIKSHNASLVMDIWTVRMHSEADPRK